ncbi:MAG: hypothetical protein HY862_17510 [Chloroflexi bacterium]|nr:hypothetical protein [Chloroflexota bacterium]
MRLEINVSLAKINEKRFHVHVEGQSLQDETTLTLEALANVPGLKILELHTEDGWGNPLLCNISEKTITIPTRRFLLEYDLQTTYTDCMGADREVYLMYPFINEYEVFLGVGCLPVPTSLPQELNDLQVQFKLMDIPAGWNIFSNGMQGQIEPTKLEGFFVYVTTGLSSTEHTYVAQKQRVFFNLVVQRGKTIPQQPYELWDYIDRFMVWIESAVAPYHGQQDINILILQAPDDFEQQTEGRAFATGENVPNGIIVYAPKNPTYLWKLFEHDNYAYFLEDGLAHELTHFYTTSNWAGRAKSVLYPSPTCPPDEARLLGEYLNQYCYNQFMYQANPTQFFTYYLSRILQKQQKRGGRSPILDLFLLDTYLQRQGHSVLALFGVMVWEKQRRPGPYESAQLMFTVMHDWLGLEVPTHLKSQLLGKEAPNYPAFVEKALAERGYRLVRHHDVLEIRQGY